MTNTLERKGPFGLWKGMSLDELTTPPVELAPFKFKTTTPPKTHSAFESYILQITQSAGLSWIKSLGKEIQTNSHGYELSSAFEIMEKKLSGIYGKPKKLDYLLDGSIWNEPRDWMTALQRKERVLASSWEGKELPDSLASVFLIAVAVDGDSGYIAIEYAFDNFNESEAEIAAMEDDAL